MQTERFLELLADRKLQTYIRGQCRRHSSREDLQEDFQSAVWEYLATLEVDLDNATIRRMVYNAIHRAYRRELENRKLLDELAEAYQAEGGGPGSSFPSGRTGGKRDGQVVLQGHELLQVYEPGFVVPLFESGSEEESATEEA